MGGLFGSKPKYPDPEPPAPMPDPEDPLAKRQRKRQGGALATTSSSATDRLAPVPGTIGQEFTRSTLGAN
ncbi:hypothetical protein SAMN02927900_01300 [Rhizobium mongolense subsp. loessense]|uniref:Uncharacterized protein n=1 Tax=Rhizobium mongolense subsp. loessense TaxID=158890 RepID=A0A1G4Q464_9HYPH|nr:hypothetical protein SAMN02927900_01300 [Rhizobium mongolense subsp. loessense]